MSDQTEKLFSMLEELGMKATAETLQKELISKS
jgi:hypothetical protein